ncbi:hypothetical protein T492DRAFT_981653 [Pavlovales sp. CCMP2436]|nr:hypothetical protein T492DRAFT_981653 [Pavlovales sp. CCMP2436]
MAAPGASSLGEDLVAHVLSFVGGREAWRARRVCQTWARSMAGTSLYATCRGSAGTDGEARPALELDLSGCRLDGPRVLLLCDLLRSRPPVQLPNAGRAPELRVDLGGLVGVGGAAVEVLRAHGGRARLVELSLCGCGELDLNTLCAALSPSSSGPGGRHLRSLSLSGCHGLRGELAAALHEYCPALTELDASGLAAAGSAALVRALGLNLRDLRLDNTQLGDCRCVPSYCHSSIPSPVPSPIPCPSLSLPFPSEPSAARSPNCTAQPGSRRRCRCAG